MKIDGSYTFEAPRETVFQMLQDPEVLAKIIPGCEQLDLVGENEYEAALEINVGPVKGKFKGKVVLSNLQPPQSYQMEVTGKGAPGFVKGTAQVRLEEQSAANLATVMSYEGDAQVGGRIASVGQRLVESAAKAMIKQSLEGVNQYVTARIQAQDSGPGRANLRSRAPTGNQSSFPGGVCYRSSQRSINRFCAAATPPPDHWRGHSFVGFDTLSFVQTTT